MLNTKAAIVPVVRINNRKLNQEFLERDLGMKTILEEGAFAEFSGHAGVETKLVLVESPSMRTRAVNGTKKLNKIIIKVDKAEEIEALLAAGTQYSKLYQGKNGFGFEAVSPEGDTFLLHAEASAEELKTILPPVPFKGQGDFSGLTAFTV
ncbi:MAG: CppA N-terminal domain-containing protein, partial [Streptococcus suis]